MEEQCPERCTAWASTSAWSRTTTTPTPTATAPRCRARPGPSRRVPAETRYPRDEPAQRGRLRRRPTEFAGASTTGSSTRAVRRPSRIPDHRAAPAHLQRGAHHRRAVPQEHPGDHEPSEMDDADAKRLVDFAAGLTFGLHGRIERVTAKVFLLSPHNVRSPPRTRQDRERILQPVLARAPHVRTGLTPWSTMVSGRCYAIRDWERDDRERDGTDDAVLRRRRRTRSTCTCW